jgi:two-component system response regulator (stage 0 sporulation protein F)
MRSEVDVLIVEDEPLARKALTLLLSSRGYHTRAVPSAEDALRCMSRAGVPKVALIDMDLPGMNGIELIKRLHALRSPVMPVLITAASRSVLQELRPTEPVAYFRKPLDVDRLMLLLGERTAAN